MGAGEAWDGGPLGQVEPADVAGQRQHGDSALGQGRVGGLLDEPGQLLQLLQVGVVRREEPLGQVVLDERRVDRLEGGLRALDVTSLHLVGQRQ